MPLKRYAKGVFGFFVCLQESKYVIVFSDLINAENKSMSRSVGNVFLMIKNVSGSLVHLSTLS
jgi:hypothetical protein